MCVLVVATFHGSEVNKVLNSDVLFGSQMSHQSLHIASIFIGDPVFDSPEFLDDFISHYRLPHYISQDAQI